MEQVISNLLQSDTIAIQKGMADLQEAFKKPETIPTLCDIIVSSNEPQIRQYSAVLLRKRLGKLRNWHMVPPEQQQVIKNGMLHAILNEQEKSVRNAIAQFVGILVKHEFGKNDEWTNDVLKFIFGHCSSSDPKQSELGSSIFAILTDTAPDQFLPHIESICGMFSAALVSTEAAGNMGTPVILNIIEGMGNLVPFILGHNGAEQTYQKSIPYIAKALLAFATQPEQYLRAFDILDNISEYVPKLLTGNLKLLIEFALSVAHNAQLDDSVRTRSVTYIGWLVRLKKKAIIKQKLIEPIIHVVFNLMATSTTGSDNDDDNKDANDEDDDEEYYVGCEESSPKTSATQTMDLLALHIPPEKLIPPLLALIEPALKGADPLYKKAAYLSMAVIAEGCSETICNKYLRPFLDCIKTGIVDQNAVVRNAAFFALGQFSEHLQPEISKFASEILPILFEYLHHLCLIIQNGESEPKHIDRMFYALETFCENLEDALIPHLPILMERLFACLNIKNTVHLRELALSVISSAASATKTNMLPYFQQIIGVLHIYCVRTEDEDICALRPQAIDTLSTIVRTIGKETFMPFTNDTMTFALSILEDSNDPELRSSLYNLLAALAEILNVNMEPVLPKIVERMLETVKSSEEVVTEFKEDGLTVFEPADENAENDIDIEQSDNEDDDDIAGYSVENAYLDEKEEAILALKQICEHTGIAFAMYIRPCFESIYKLLDHPQEDIRKVSIDALVQFIIALHKLNNENDVREAIQICIPKIGEIIKSDEDTGTVMSALEAYSELLKNLNGLACHTNELKSTIFDCIQLVLSSKVVCQFDENTGASSGGGGGDDEQEESEFDEALIEMAGDVLPKFGLAITPEEFALYFGRIWSLFTIKIEKSKREDLASQRSFSYGTLSECFKPLQSFCATWFDSLLPLYLYGLMDPNEQVRHNVVFGLGELVYYSEEKSFDKFPTILQALSVIVTQEEHAGVLDNICGALARLISTNYKLVPLQQVLPIFVQKLPLREDFDENLSIFKCFKLLLTQDNNSLVHVLDRVILIGLHVLFRKEYKDDETQLYILAFLEEVRKQFSDKFNVVANSDPEIATFVQSLYG